MKGDALLWGYCEGDLVEVHHNNEWIPSRVVGKVRRDLAAVPLDGDSAAPWIYVNPARIRRMSQERLEQWLEEGS